MAPEETLTVPTQSHGVSVHNSTSSSGSRKPWRLASSKNRQQLGQDDLRRENTHQSRRSGASMEPAWWKTRLFSGMINDVRRRAPFYWSDWKDAWDYRVVPATVYMYFAKYVCRRNVN